MAKIRVAKAQLGVAPGFLIVYGLVGGQQLFDLVQYAITTLQGEGVIPVSIDDLARLMRLVAP